METHILTVWNAAKAVVRGKFIVINAYIKKKETSQRSNLTLLFKELEVKNKLNLKLAERGKNKD